MLKKNLLIPAVGLIFIFILNGCVKKLEVTEAPETEEVTVAITPSTEEIKGEIFTLELSDLKIIKTVNKTTKGVIGSPSLRGNVKISNNSTNILDIKELSIQYLDSWGNPIPFEGGKKKATLQSYGFSDIQPEKHLEKSLTVNIPIAAVEEKSLNKIRSNVVYVSIPLKRENMDFSVTMEK